LKWIAASSVCVPLIALYGGASASASDDVQFGGEKLGGEVERRVACHLLAGIDGRLVQEPDRFQAVARVLG
jgi:hypothetical protein